MPRGPPESALSSFSYEASHRIFEGSSPFAFGVLNWRSQEFTPQQHNTTHTKTQTTSTNDTVHSSSDDDIDRRSK
ncbi:hypothetical protein CEP54_003940 [Fusarium duplospermum]|uniref:Uncharacterized protein n=1 Tax=Fusarium duplospermum TaxID=1325734 RepID=A0A428QLG3_9HYPO|nr:hypothetical protein CEP54_003940 [Fusarium duplospermum]